MEAWSEPYGLRMTEASLGMGRCRPEPYGRWRDGYMA
jgi:hypothetical protein